jgi:hypothetical protein
MMKQVEERFAFFSCIGSDDPQYSPASGSEGFIKTPTMRREASADL